MSCEELTDGKVSGKWRRRSLVIVVTLLLGTLTFVLLTAPMEVKAAVLYVGGIGPGNYTTIQAAIDAASPGDTIYVYNGTYNERIAISKTLSLIGESRETTVIDGRSVGTVVGVSADWVNITGFAVIGAGRYSAGILLSNVQNARIEYNNLSEGYYDGAGIQIDRSRGNIIAYNEFIVNNNSLWIQQSDGNLIANNYFTGSEHGIFLSASSTNIIRDNTLSSNDFGSIELSWFSNSNLVANNTVENTTYAAGIGVYFSANNSVMNNTIVSSTRDAGIELYSTVNAVLLDNTMAGYGILVSGKLLEHWNSHTIDITNTVNAKPVYYWKDVVGGTIPPDAGQAILANCTGVVVENQNATDIQLGFSSRNTVSNLGLGGGMGARLYGSNNNSLSNNTALPSTLYGFYLDFSDGNILSGNYLEKSGIDLHYSNYTYIVENTIVSGNIDLSSSYYNHLVNNSLSNSGLYSMSFYLSESKYNLLFGNEVSGSYAGIRLGTYSNFNLLSNNTLTDNSEGIYMGSANLNVIVNNTIARNTKYGIYIYDGGENAIYHNNFIDNAKQAYDYRGQYHWDDGYPSGGNYWSDYTGIDQKSGPNQDLPGSDGIGDTPYEIEYPYPGTGRTDYYPLMRPVASVLPSVPRNLRASPGNQQVTLAWDPPLFNGSMPVTNYAIYRGTVSGGEVFLKIVGNVLTYTDTGLTNGQTYFYEVSAISSAGEGPKSNEANTTPVAVPTPPSAPWNLRATAGNGQVTLNWNAPASDGGSPITNYRLYRGTTPGGESLLAEIGDVLTYVDAGLTNGQDYFYQVTAKNAIGESPRSNEANATPTSGPRVPGPPVGLGATAGNRQVALSWSPPADSGGSPVMNYRIYRGTVPGGESFLTEIGNITTHLDVGLTNGQTYFYKVAAVNIAGVGPKSNEASATPATIPDAPTGLTAVGGDAQVTLTWSAPLDNGGSPVTNYRVYRGTAPGGEVYITQLGNVLTHIDSGLTNGQKYYYKVSGVNSLGEGPQSNEANATPMAGATAPSQPGNLQAVAGNAQVTLTWEAPISDGGSPVTNFRIYRGTSSGGETFLAELGYVLTYVDAGLTNGLTYYYQVTAKNAVGESLRSNEASATPATQLKVPRPPTGLTAAAGDRQGTLAWLPPSDDGGASITNYLIYRGASSGGETLIVELGNVLTYVDAGLSNGQTYFYQVTAKNALGESPKSNEASATPAKPSVNYPPTCNIIAPIPGAKVAGTYVIAGMASDIDGTVQKVEVRIDSGEWIEASGKESWTYTWDTTTPSNGQHTVSARSYDGTNYSIVVSIVITVENVVSQLPPREVSMFQQGWFWILLAVAVIETILLLFLFLKGRKGKASQEEQPPETPLADSSEDSKKDDEENGEHG